MKTSDFDYELPKDLIAHNPSVPRDHCKLFVYDSRNNSIFHCEFFDLKKFLSPGDTLVLNRSRVIPARLIFKISDKECEIFLLKKAADDSYESMVRPGKFFSHGMTGRIGNSLIWTVKTVNSDGTRCIKFSSTRSDRNVDVLLEKLGNVPLPPYIKNSNARFSQYQTVYSKEKGSVAAPTAGLHFTNGLIGSLKKGGVNFAEVVLHVGRGTFLPVVAENLSEHVMHKERFQISSGAVSQLNLTKKLNHRIVAVGTTSCRVLESTFSPEDGFHASSGDTDIFIYPHSYRWKCVDALITNFHLPKSTLLMLVASFLESKGVKDPVSKLLELYHTAIKERYRFYSFGDAMLIL